MFILPNQEQGMPFHYFIFSLYLIYIYLYKFDNCLLIDPSHLLLNIFLDYLFTCVCVMKELCMG